MYLISFEGWEMKARTETAIRDWLNVNMVDAAFRWSELRRDGGMESLCGRWAISKADGRAISAVDWLENYAWLGGVLVNLKSVE